jgi:hypothetical protein
MTDLLDEQLAIRDDLSDFLEADLIGPGTADEVLKVAPLDKYVTGILYPQLEDSQNVDPEVQEGDEDDGGDGSADPAIAMSNVQYPSSAGISFATAADIEELTVSVQVARYAKAEEGGWAREAIGPVDVGIPAGATNSDKVKVIAGLKVYWQVREVAEGARSVTVVLMNTQTARRGLKDAASFFQTSFSVVSTRGDGAPFVARREKVDISDEDQETNRLLYRDAPEFAIGHGCAADWVQKPGTRTASRVSATFLPQREVPIVESNPDIDVGRLGFRELSTAARQDVVANLRAFLGEYDSWIGKRELEVAMLDDELAKTAAEHLGECRKAKERIDEGIAVLEDEPAAFRAFQLANRAMADQMEKGASGAGEPQAAWRPFQLAFVLLAIPSMVDGTHPDRMIADLLWFPTGGGKTEAYLALFAFTVFHRRISKGGAGGTTAIMRYTLRLLTSQQFERAAKVICACELIRKSEGDLGADPISLGLFVGSDSTPSTIAQAKASLKRLRNNARVGTKNPVQLHRCPWCDVPLEHVNYVTPDDPSRLQIECREPSCEFKDGLPVFVVDEDLYRVQPSLVIGTVDKFAALPWRPEVGNLFNLDDPAVPPPELIIQDELHLISGPLGTMTGLYETAIDMLAERDGIRPKVIASTATIRRARAQSEQLFARDMRQFPPPGLDPGHSWFATVAPADKVGTRRYVGLMAPGVSHATLLIRAYAALLQEAGTHERGPALDPYWTMIGYFNSLRVLGAARMQVQDDVREWLETIAGDEARQLREPVELTSRIDSADIPKRLKEMEVALPSEYALDVVLATNMISVGVDVDRLGLMAVMGQPQGAAEYIQATSRVGRKYPGLVISLLNAARSRDRSHYEGFCGFHSALYRSVEATSVTPFSPRARDRGLHAVLVALARLRIDGLRDNEDASSAPAHVAELEAVKDAIVARVKVIDPAQVDGTDQDLRRIIGEWLAYAEERPGLVYESLDEKDFALLTTAAPDLEQEGFSTMWSLRNVDAVSNLHWASGLR